MNLETSGGKKEHKTPKTDIEDAVVVEEVSGAKKEVETVNVSEESEEATELKVIESLNTLEEVEGVFLIAKEKFEKLADGVEGNNVDFGRSVISLFEGVNHSYDENVIKNLKIQYLKRLYKCIDELAVAVMGGNKPEEVPLNNVEKNEELDQKFEEYKIKFESFSDGVGFEAPMAVQPASNLIEKYKQIKNQTLNDDLILDKEKLIYNLGLRIAELQVASSPKQESLVKPEKTQHEDNDEYAEKRKEFLVAKKEYQEKKEVYEGALRDFYDGRDWLDKTGDGVKKFFGISPRLPDSLQFLENEYKLSKKAYAEGLNSALLERSKKTYSKTEIKDGKEEVVQIKNREYNEKSDSAKIAFAEKFILQPHEQLLKIQEDIALSEAQRSKFKRIMRTMSEKKWFTRMGMVTMVGLTGGASAALIFGGRMAVSIVGGVIGAEVARYFTQGAVDESKMRYENKKSSLSKSFSIKDLDSLESELLSAQEGKEDAIRNQKLAMFASAFFVGGMAGHGAHSIINSGGIAEAITPDVDSGSHFAGSGPKIDMSGEREAFLSVDGVESDPPASDAVLSTESVAEVSEIYTVERGDTLWEIMEKRYATELDGLSTVEKNRVLDTLFDKVRDDAGLLKSLELKSHDNIDLIYTGEKINLTALGKELERMADIERGEGVLPPYVKQSSLPVQDGGGVVQQIPIKSQEVPDSVVKTESPLPKVVISEPAPISPDIPPLPKGFYPDNYFKTPSYMEDVKRVFGGEQHFNRVLGREILDVEKRAYDWLTPRERFTSPYEFFKVMKIEDIEKLSQDPNVRIHVQQYGMKYEAFLAWVDKIREMKASGLPSTPGTYLSDLFSRYMVEKFSGRIK